MASTLVLSGKPGIWSGQYPGTQPPDDDCTQEVLNLNDIDRYDNMIGSSIKTTYNCLGEYLILQTRPSFSVCASVFLMIFGAIVAAIDDLAFSMTG